MPPYPGNDPTTMDPTGAGTPGPTQPDVIQIGSLKIPTKVTLPGTNIDVNWAQGATNWVDIMKEQQKRAGASAPRPGELLTGQPPAQMQQASFGGAATTAQGGLAGPSPVSGMKLPSAAGTPFVGRYGPQTPYYTGGETGKGAVANTVIGLSNLLNRTREQNQKQEYIQAQATWQQIVNAYDAMQAATAQGRTDPSAEALYKKLTGDPKVAKMMQESLGIVMGQQEGGDQQGKQKAPPEETAGSRGLRAVLRGVEQKAGRAGRAVGGMFDPRTAMQRPSPGGQMPAPGTPGSNMPGIPQPTEEAKAMAQIREIEAQTAAAMAIAHPEMMQKKAAMDMGMIPDANTLAKIESMQDYYRSQIGYKNALTEKAYGEMRNSTYRLYLATTDEERKQKETAIKAAQTATLGSGLPGIEPGGPAEKLTGQDYANYLYSIGQNVLAYNAAQVANYDMRADSFRAFGSKNPVQFQLLMAAAKRINPNFNGTDYEAEQRSMRDWVTPSGKGWFALRQLNQAMPHLASLYNTYMALNNSGWTWWNYDVNWAAQKTPSNPVLAAYVAKFNEDANAAADELGAVFKLGNQTDVQIENWHKDLIASANPGYLFGQLSAIFGLVASRLPVLQQGIDESGLPPGRVQILNPQSKQVAAWLMQQSFMGHPLVAAEPWQDTTASPFQLGPPTEPVTVSPEDVKKYGSPF